MIGLNFQEDTHTYTLEGRTVPSVTTVLEAEGYSNPFTHNEYAAGWGSMAHKTVELDCTGRLGSYDPAFEPWMEGIRAFRAKHNPQGDFERRVYWKCGPMEYAGTADFVGVIGHREYVLDWKFWASKSKDLIAIAGLQLAAYEMALRNGPKRNRAVVWFFPGGFRLIPLTDTTDEPVWRGIVNGYYWKKFHLNRKVA
jgi:hypothetical protein